MLTKEQPLEQIQVLNQTNLAALPLYHRYEDHKAIPFIPNLKGVFIPVKTTCTSCRKVTETIVRYETTPK